MERILVLGRPGCGKSYFSKRLGKILNISVIHLDNLYWDKNKISIPTKELEKKILPFMDDDKWILDGNFHDILESRLAKCDTAFFLDLSSEECINGINERTNLVRDDLPWIQNEEDAKRLIDWTNSYVVRTREKEIELLKKYTHVNVIILKSREDVNKYLENLLKR